jgi:hypothetical protein
LGLKELCKNDIEGTNPTMNDPRASVLATALDGESDLALKGQDGNLLADVVKAIEGGSTAANAILTVFSNLVLIPLEKVEETQASNCL